MIGEGKGIIIHRVDSAEQKASIFTKGLTQETFESIRKLLMGWWHSCRQEEMEQFNIYTPKL
jgi:hypothetical protein